MTNGKGIAPLDAAGAEARRREREFHDALAKPLRAADLPARSPDALEAALLDALGDLSGLRVVELGCGTGDLTLLLLQRWPADLVALDLSPRMVGVAQARVERLFPGGPVTFRVAPVENTGLHSGQYDVVVGKWILHHADVEGGAHEIRRILRPGGKAVFIENSGLNPLLTFARARLTGRFGIPKYGTDDEHPLLKRDFCLYRQVFSSVHLEFPDFFVLRLLDRQVLKFRHRRLSLILRKLDALIWYRCRFARRFSYHVILHLDA